MRKRNTILRKVTSDGGERKEGFLVNHLTGKPHFNPCLLPSRLSSSPVGMKVKPGAGLSNIYCMFWP